MSRTERPGVQGTMSGSRSSSGGDGGLGGSTARRFRVIGFSGHTGQHSTVHDDKQTDR